MFSLYDSPVFTKNSPTDSNYLHSPISTNSNDSLTNNEKKNLSINLNFSFSSNPLTPSSPNDLNTSLDSYKVNQIKEYLICSPLNNFYTNFFTNNLIESNNEEINEENVFDFILEKEVNDDFSNYTKDYMNLNQSISQLYPSLDYMNDYLNQNSTKLQINNQSFNGLFFSGQNQSYQSLNFSNSNCQSLTCQMPNCHTLNCNNSYWKSNSPMYDSNLFLRDYLNEAAYKNNYSSNNFRFNENEYKKDNFKMTNNIFNFDQMKSYNVDNFKKSFKTVVPKKSVSHVYLLKQDLDLVKNFAHQLVFVENSNRFAIAILQDQIKKWFIRNMNNYKFLKNTNELCIFHLNEHLNDPIGFGIIKIGPKNRFFQAPKNCFRLYVLLIGDVMLKIGSNLTKYKSKDYCFIQTDPLCQHSIINLSIGDAFLFFAISR